MSSIRRVYYYLVCLITLGILAAGVHTLLFLLFDITFGGESVVGRADFIQQQLSLGLAMLVIGGPLWFFFWRTIQRHAGDSPVEIGAVMRQFFLKLILVVTSLMSLFAAKDFLTWLLAGVPRSHNAAGSLAILIVTISIWYYYWRISEGDGHPSIAALTLRRWYTYIASGFGLVLLATGVVQFIYGGLLSLPIWGTVLIEEQFWTTAVQGSISWIIVAGLFWSFHWFHVSPEELESTLRQVYIYLLAILGSSIAGLVALVIALDQTFVWALRTASQAGGYFQFLGWTIPTIIVAAAIWSYHQFLAREEAVQAQERRLSSERIHLYIMSFLGLGTMIAGVVILLGILLDLLINSISAPIAVQQGWWQKQLGLCLALLLVAVPLWIFYWNQVVRLSDKGGVVERRARSRRVYLYVVVGAAIIALAADLVNIIYRLLSGGLTGNFGVNVLQNIKWSIQSLVVAAPLLVYHWKVAREDQRWGAEAAVIHKLVTVLADSQSRDFISRLQDRLGYKVEVMEYTGTKVEIPIFSEDEMAKLVDEIESSPLETVMLVLYEGKLLVLPYRER